MGYLKNEVDATVAVTGCVTENNRDAKMSITLISKRSLYQKSFSFDLSGNFEPIVKAGGNTILVDRQLFSRALNMSDEGDALGDPDIEAKAMETILGGRNSVPFAIKVKIKVGTDASARDTITNNFNITVQEWISEVFTHIQAHYHHPSLRHRVNFEVHEIIILFKVYH